MKSLNHSGIWAKLLNLNVSSIFSNVFCCQVPLMCSYLLDHLNILDSLDGERALSVCSLLYGLKMASQDALLFRSGVKLELKPLGLRTFS